MNTIRLSVIALALAATGLVACGGSNNTDANQTSGNPQTVLGRSVDRAMSKAREELHRDNLDISQIPISIDGRTNEADANLPKAEITPAGDFLVQGATVDITEQQREMLLAYRSQAIAMIEAGMAIGVSGADLGMRAVTEVAKGIFSGNPDSIKENIEGQAEAIKTQARALCLALQPMYQSQQALAQSLEAFKPYATLNAESAQKCEKGMNDGSVPLDEQALTQAIESAVGAASQATATAVASAQANSTSINGIGFVLPNGAVETENNNGDIRIRHSNGLRVRLQDDRFEVNGEPYPAPTRGDTVDLREPGVVRINQQVVTMQP